MAWFFTRLIYRMALPWLLFLALPAWIIKMLKRGGIRTPLGERATIYQTDISFEPCSAVHLHAVSVGEAMLALKLIRKWKVLEPTQAFVIATGTSTGYQVAHDAMLDDVRVTYAPLDLPSMVARYLKRFEPSQIVLVEGEAWPNLLDQCQRNQIPVSLINARMSPTSARRYRRFAAHLRPLFSSLDGVALQYEEDREIWQSLGVPDAGIFHAGSLKIDPGISTDQEVVPEFESMLEAIGGSRPRVLLASSHAGEEAWVASAIIEATCHALPIIVPRHAERRAEVIKALQTTGLNPVLRSHFHFTNDSEKSCLIVDSTGELRDWILLADVVIIGKSFFAIGGQNPCEAIVAKRPIIFGPHMENFQPLAQKLLDCGGALLARDASELVTAIHTCLDLHQATQMTARASQWIAPHQGAAERIIHWLKKKGDPRR
ncbi:MAG: hypothetical protein EAZ42_06860 [Verrucomicrobia bacterium]|nr:MAG: hypothetical protein EAZ42_06860 [Verrucomicrobiota bacterium]